MALQQYADGGGRVFASHWHNYWFEHGPAPWPTIANFNHQADLAIPFTATIDTSFQRGAELAQWLVNVGGSTTLGQLVIRGAQHTINTVGTGRQWIYSTKPAVGSVPGRDHAVPGRGLRARGAERHPRVDGRRRRRPRTIRARAWPIPTAAGRRTCRRRRRRWSS